MNQQTLKTAPAWIRFAAKITRQLPVARGRIIDWLFRDFEKRFLAKMSPELGGHVFDCSTHDIVARHVFFSGSYAQHEVAFMRGVLKPGMCFVDVGAHWGLLTMLASHLVGDTGQVIALEPDPRRLAKLRSNLELNCIANVRAFEVAAVDCDTHVTFSAADEWTSPSLVECISNRSQFVAWGRRLDDLLNEEGEGNVDLIKIDVEGAEDLVLQGMEVGLNRQRYSRILLELHPRQLSKRSRTMSDIADFLITRGYRGYTLDSSRKGCRSVYYDPWQHFSRLLLPLEVTIHSSNVHDSPHTVWVRPDLPWPE
jgi:FkbM family methyltransferase